MDWSQLEAFGLLACRWLLSLVFLLAGLSKLRDAADTSRVVARYGIIPQRYVAALTRLLPWSELTVAVGLAVGVGQSAVGWTTVSALVMFSSSVIINLARHRHFECGCGIAGSTEIGWGLVARNMVLILLAAVIATGPASGLSLGAGKAAMTAKQSGTSLTAVPLIVALIVMSFRTTVLSNESPRSLLMPLYHCVRSLLRREERIVAGLRVNR